MPTEFSLIDRLTEGFARFHPVHTGVGDDAAVLELPGGDFQVITTDTMVEGDHFRTDWSTPEQIGAKLAECNVSDIAAMGGTPTYALANVVLRGPQDTEWIQRVYAGMKERFDEHKVTLIGGDTTHGRIRMLSLTVLGVATPADLTKRSGAQPGDLICVTGQVGGSAAGWHMLRQGLTPPPYPHARHAGPQCRLGASRHIAPLATAMADVSDGVASEARHIADQSHVGVVIDREALPVHPEVRAVEKELGLQPGTCALSGGEDFELLFTLAPEKEAELRATFDDFTVIGTVTVDPKERVLLTAEGNLPLPHGWDHMAHTNKAEEG